MIPKIRQVKTFNPTNRYSTKEELELQSIACKNALLELKEKMGDVPFNDYAGMAIKRTKQLYTVEDMMENAAKMLYYYILFQEGDKDHHG